MMKIDLKKEDAKVLRNVIAFIKERCKMEITGQEYFAMNAIFERQLSICKMIDDYQEEVIIEDVAPKKKREKCQE